MSGQERAEAALRVLQAHVRLHPHPHARRETDAVRLAAAVLRGPQ